MANILTGSTTDFQAEKFLAAKTDATGTYTDDDIPTRATAGLFNHYDDQFELLNKAFNAEAAVWPHSGSFHGITGTFATLGGAVRSDAHVTYDDLVIGDTSANAAGMSFVVGTGGTAGIGIAEASDTLEQQMNFDLSNDEIQFRIADNFEIIFGSSYLSPNTDNDAELGESDRAWGNLYVHTASIIGPTSGSYETKNFTFVVTTGNEVMIPWNEQTETNNILVPLAVPANGIVKGILFRDNGAGGGKTFTLYEGTSYDTIANVLATTPNGHITSSAAAGNDPLLLKFEGSDLTGSMHFTAGNFIWLSMSGTANWASAFGQIVMEYDWTTF